MEEGQIILLTVMFVIITLMVLNMLRRKQPHIADYSFIESPKFMQLTIQLTDLDLDDASSTAEAADIIWKYADMKEVVKEDRRGMENSAEKLLDAAFTASTSGAATKTADKIHTDVEKVERVFLHPSSDLEEDYSDYAKVPSSHANLPDELPDDLDEDDQYADLDQDTF